MTDDTRRMLEPDRMNGCDECGGLTAHRLGCSVTVRELTDAWRDVAALNTAAGDQAQAMSDRELGELLLLGRWTTVEIREAGHRLIGDAW